MKETTYYLNAPVSICLLTDLHESNFSFLSDVRKHKPDLIAVPGDVLRGYVTDDDHLSADRMIPFLSACMDIAPTFYSIGNHEWMLHEDDIDLIESIGVKVLDNRWVTWSGISIGGLTSASAIECRRLRGDSSQRYPDKIIKQSRFQALKQPWQPDISWLDEFSAQSGYKLLLSHHPEYWPQIRNYDIDLVLSGHAHGGQIRIAGHGLFAPGQGFLPKLTSGVHDDRLVISRGLSNPVIVPRLFNPCEIVYIKPLH